MATPTRTKRTFTMPRVRPNNRMSAQHHNKVKKNVTTTIFSSIAMMMVFFSMLLPPNTFARAKNDDPPMNTANNNVTNDDDEGVGLPFFTNHPTSSSTETNQTMSEHFGQDWPMWGVSTTNSTVNSPLAQQAALAPTPEMDDEEYSDEFELAASRGGPNRRTGRRVPGRYYGYGYGRAWTSGISTTSNIVVAPPPAPVGPPPALVAAQGPAMTSGAYVTSPQQQEVYASSSSSCRYGPWGAWSSCSAPAVGQEGLRYRSRVVLHDDGSCFDATQQGQRCVRRSGSGPL